MNTNWHDLIQRHMEGLLNEEEAATFQSSLTNDPELRRLYLHYMNLDVALEAHAGSSTTVNNMLLSPHHGKTNRWTGWLSWRPPAAAAAGLILGMLCTSMVWAYTMPRIKMNAQRTMPLFVESFEDERMVPLHGFPTHAGDWFGDLSAAVVADAEAKPADGKRMVRLVPNPKRMFSYAWRMVDLSAYPQAAGTESRQLEVTASFCGAEAPSADRYQIRLAAFSEEPGEVRAIWNGDGMFDQVLQHVGRTVTMKPGDHGWHTLHATMEIPSGARSLVISLAAAVADDDTPKSAHYLDDVHARFIVTDAIP